MASSTSISRRNFLRLTTAGAATVALAACAAPVPVAPSAGEASLPGAEPVTIEYWHIWGGVRAEQLQQILDTFTEEHSDIQVEPLLLPNPGYADKIITGLAGDAPDLMMITTEEFAPSARRGALRQLDDLLDQDGISPDIWYPGIWDMTQLGGSTFGIPFVGNFLTMLYWNKADFREGGFDPDQGPQTWDELIQIAEGLTSFDDRGNIQNMGYTPGSWGEWMQAVYRNGHDWLGNGESEQIAIDHPQVLEALQFVMELYESMGGWDTVGAATEAWGNQQLGNPMIAGVASSISSGVFTVNIINDQAPNLEYAIGHLPHGPNGQFVDVIQNSWNNAIPTRAAHPEAAWELAKYLSIGDGHLTFMVEMQGRPAMIREYNEAPYDMAAREVNPYWDQVLEILNGQQVSFPVSEGLESVKSALQEAFEMVMLERSEPEEALAWAQTEVIRIFTDLQ